MELNYWEDIKPSFLDHILFKAISLLPEKERNDFSAEKQNGKWGYDVELIVNGHKLPVIKAFNLIGEQLDYMVKKEAARLVDEKLNDIFEKAYDIGNLVESSHKELDNRVNEILGIKNNNE